MPGHKLNQEQVNAKEKTRLVLVTDKENKVGSHVPGLPNFLLGQEIRLISII